MFVCRRAPRNFNIREKDESEILAALKLWNSDLTNRTGQLTELLQIILDPLKVQCVGCCDNELPFIFLILYYLLVQRSCPEVSVRSCRPCCPGYGDGILHLYVGCLISIRSRRDLIYSLIMPFSAAAMVFRLCPVPRHRDRHEVRCWSKQKQYFK